MMITSYLSRSQPSRWASYFCCWRLLTWWRTAEKTSSNAQALIPLVRLVIKDPKKHYALKKRSATEKMAYQLFKALNDTQGLSKPEHAPFSVPIPKNIPKEKRPYAPLSYAVAQHQGSKLRQEDGYLANVPIEFTWKGENKKGVLFAVIDGHNDNRRMTEHLNGRFQSTLEGVLNDKDNGDDLDDEVIADAFVETFHLLSESYRGPKGATVLCLFAIDGRIYFPNAGDSRALLVGAETYQLTEDATLDNDRFKKWYINRGEEFHQAEQGTLRLECGLNMGRELGLDTCHRPKITVALQGDGVNDLKRGIIYAKKGSFFLLASDGFFEAATNKEAGNEIRKLDRAGASLAQMAEGLANTAGSFKGNDNVTTLIVAF